MNCERLNAAFPAGLLRFVVALTLTLAGLAGCGGPTQPPLVIITSPAANATVDANTPMTIQGMVTGENLAAANITRIEVILDGVPFANAPVSEEA
ncbi:MAG: Ig-like domain-containing protein, partial [Candidatus Roseilinea sp.]|uniref:Ig-like domain-containing protein n=1 Tax=Candidatus Roseilinea sp. TaxID=2838777 RepID=UPI004049C36F